MQKNVGGIDRTIRIVAGLVLMVLGAVFFSKALGIALLVIGLVVLGTGVFRFCGLYTLLGINTCPINTTEKEKSV